MAKIKCIRPIESISGKIKKTDKTGFALRKASNRNFTVTRENWSPDIAEEKQASVAARKAKFAAVQASARERMEDPTHMEADLKGFEAQSKYTTLFGYVFAKEWASYVEPSDDNE